MKNGTKGSLNCNGVLIAPDSVLTSTMCKPDVEATEIYKIDYKLHLNNHKIHRISIFHRPKKVEVTDLSKNSKDHFLILKLNEDVKDKVPLICIPTEEREEKNSKEREYVTAGWTWNDKKGRISKEPRLAVLPFEKLKEDRKLTVAFGTDYFTSMQLESFEMGQPIMYKEDGRWFLHSIFTHNMKSDYKHFDQKAIANSVTQYALKKIVPRTCTK